MPSLPVYREYLAAKASQLASTYSSLPLPIGRICFSQGIVVERSFEIQQFKAKMMLPRSASDWAIVHLPERSETTPPHISYDRFCLAHELAHLLVFRKFDVIPNGESEYWKHEQICDSFARALLIPEEFVNASDLVLDPTMYCSKLADVAKIPVMHAARRLTELNPSINVFRLRADRGRIAVFSTSVAHNVGRGRKLGGMLAHRIASVYNTHRVLRWSVSGDTLRSGGLMGFDVSSEYMLIAEKERVGSDVLAVIFNLGGAGTPVQGNAGSFQPLLG